MRVLITGGTGFGSRIADLPAVRGRPPLVLDAPPEPRSTYAATKVAQEHLVAAWARQTGDTAWSLRHHDVYGPRMPRDTPYAGVASIFRSVLARVDAPTVLAAFATDELRAPAGVSD